MTPVNKFTGLPIVGILERMLVTYPVNDLKRLDTGEITFEYPGGTANAHWDTAEPVEQRGRKVFVDEDGEECTEDEIEFREEAT